MVSIRRRAAMGYLPKPLSDYRTTPPPPPPPPTSPPPSPPPPPMAEKPPLIEAMRSPPQTSSCHLNCSPWDVMDLDDLDQFNVQGLKKGEENGQFKFEDDKRITIPGVISRNVADQEKSNSDDDDHVNTKKRKDKDTIDAEKESNYYKKDEDKGWHYGKSISPANKMFDHHMKQQERACQSEKYGKRGKINKSEGYYLHAKSNAYIYLTTFGPGRGKSRKGVEAEEESKFKNGFDASIVGYIGDTTDEETVIKKKRGRKPIKARTIE